jgi:hypothetical protein
MGTAILESDGLAGLAAKQCNRLAKEHAADWLAADVLSRRRNIPVIPEEHGRFSLLSFRSARAKITALSPDAAMGLYFHSEQTASRKCPI